MPGKVWHGIKEHCANNKCKILQHNLLDTFNNISSNNLKSSCRYCICLKIDAVRWMWEICCKDKYSRLQGMPLNPLDQELKQVLDKYRLVLNINSCLFNPSKELWHNMLSLVVTLVTSHLIQDSNKNPNKEF